MNRKSIYRYTVLKQWRRKRQTGKKQDEEEAEEKQEQGRQGDGERKKRQEGGEGKRRPGLEGREARTREGGCSPNTRDFFLLQESDISRKQWSPSLNAERQKK